MDKHKLKEFTVKSIIVIAILAIAALIVLYSQNIILGVSGLINIITPFIWGGCIAYLLVPICNKIKNKLDTKKKRKHSDYIAIAITETAFILLVFIMLLIIVPQCTVSIVNIAKKLPDAVVKAETIIADTIHNVSWLNALEVSLANVEDIIGNYIKNDIVPNFDKIVQSIIVSATSVGKMALNIVLGIFISIFALANRKNFAEYSTKLLRVICGDKLSNMVLEELLVANRMFSGFIVGKMIDSIIIGIMCLIVTSLLGMPYAGLVSLIVGITNIVPIVGPFIGAVPGFIIIFSESPIQSLYFIIFIIILQQIDGNYIGPKCIGSATNLSTFWVLFAIIFFGGLWGFIGMIVGVPLLAVLFDILNKFIDYKENKLNLEVDKTKEV